MIEAVILPLALNELENELKIIFMSVNSKSILLNMISKIEVKYSDNCDQITFNSYPKLTSFITELNKFFNNSQKIKKHPGRRPGSIYSRTKFNFTHFLRVLEQMDIPFSIYRHLVKEI